MGNNFRIPRLLEYDSRYLSISNFRQGRIAIARAGIAAILFGSISSASSQVFHSGVVDITIPIDFQGVHLDPTTGVFQNTPFSDGTVNFFFGGLGIAITGDSPDWQPIRTGTGNMDSVVNLTTETTVDSNSVFSSGFGGSINNHLGNTIGQFDEVTPTPGFIGFSLENSITQYGWMRVTLDSTNGGVIHEWAFDESGAPIVVGTIPEPGIFSLGSLAIIFTIGRRKRSLRPKS